LKILQKGADIVRVILKFFANLWWFIAERKEVLSSLLLNAGLVFLATMVLSDYEDTRLGLLLTVVSLLVGFILSRGGK